MIRIDFIILLMALIVGAPVVLTTGCASSVPVTSDGITNEMAGISRDIASNRGALNLLQEKRVGKTGFYYVLDSEGKVVFHPRSPLIGTSFSKIWFIRQLLKERTGCLTYTLGNRKHYVFFSPLNDSEILCLSIVSEDLRRPAECKTADVKTAD